MFFFLLKFKLAIYIYDYKNIFFLTNLLKNNMRTNLLINQLKPQINDTSFCSKASSCLLFIHVIKF
jgi:hypothetical protein